MAGVYKDMLNDLTLVYYSTDTIPKGFMAKTHGELLKLDLPMVEIHQDPSVPRSHLQIYRNALEGAKKATTTYIALCEDDVLYHPDHFKFRPHPGYFGYNINCWAIFTWVKPPIFNYKNRINLSGLICDRELFIEAMEERFAKYPNENDTPIESWAEPGKYEKNLGVTERKIQLFTPDNPNVAFSHPTALSYLNLGLRKKMGQPRALEIPFWGKAEDIVKLYE